MVHLRNKLLPLCIYTKSGGEINKELSFEVVGDVKAINVISCRYQMQSLSIRTFFRAISHAN